MVEHLWVATANSASHYLYELGDDDVLAREREREREKARTER